MKYFAISFLSIILASCDISKPISEDDGIDHSVHTEIPSYHALPAQAEEFGGIKGIVEDEYGEPLIGATVKLSTVGVVKMGAHTDLDGRFHIKQIPPGTYTIEVSYIGSYSEYADDIAIEAGKLFQFDQVLVVESQIEDLKPIIYLYPEESTQVHVELDYDGKLTTSYPIYTEGWTVKAEPDGTLHDLSGREYYALYWEGNPTTPLQLKNGAVVAKEETIDYLEASLKTLGLNPREANEFIVFWLPILEKNDFNLIHFAESDYEEQAKLIITPTPETIIRVMMVFQPLDEPIIIDPQDLTQLSKKRKGFTVVEWGGQPLPKAYPIEL
ncbi:MAG: hypothetical protein ACI837_000223 [Crocinitomicaceae bacterium]|jgi:hypothetical protein